MESVNLPMQEPPVNDAQLSSWKRLTAEREVQRASAFPVISQACVSNGYGLISVNVRPDVIGKKLMANVPSVRTCLICGKSMHNEESWIFMTNSRSAVYVHRKRAAHVTCVEQQKVEMVRNGEA